MGRTDECGYERAKRISKRLIFISISLIISLIIMKISLFNNDIVFAEARSSSITIECSTKKVLNGENINTRLPMASTTKVMTALLACESDRMNETVTIPDAAVGIEGSSIYLRKGEKMTLRDLVYGLMLRSGNDSAVAIAITLGGSVENFAQLMNNKVEELGLSDTHFINPHGLESEGHYTSAYDLACITATALQNEEFCKIVSTKMYTIPSSDSEHEPRYIANKNKLLSMYEGAIGVKTGFTKAAGRCFVGAAERDGLVLVNVVLNHPDMWNDCMRGMEEGFANCKKVEIAPANVCLARLAVNGKDDGLGVYIKNSVMYPFVNGEINELEFLFKPDNNLFGTIKMGDKVGILEIYDDKRLIFTENIYSMEDIIIGKRGVGSLRRIAGRWTNWYGEERTTE